MPDYEGQDAPDVLDDFDGLDSAVADAGDAGPECSFLTGIAGTGKTTLVKSRIAEDPQYALLTATTGIAAVNLDCVTLNSKLGYFDDASLRDCYVSGRLGKRLRDLVREGTRNLLVEEVSMLTGTALDTIYRAAKDTREASTTGRPLGLILVGDFCQLPPVNGTWAFEADCWPQFEANTERLTHVWRQQDAAFIAALNAARRGDGAECAGLLTAEGVRFEDMLDMDFAGTTILPLNKQVEPYNADRLSRVRSPLLSVKSRRWGKQRGEWKNIPEVLELKVGAYVMLLANAPSDGGRSLPAYVNGDCGYILSNEGERWVVKLERTGQEVTVGKLVRSVTQKDAPSGGGSDYVGEPGEYFDEDEEPWRMRKHGWVTGQLEYVPLRLAYATTIHKSQGLSLDRVQFDVRHRFTAAPAMCYVALSRCRTLQGLRLVGDAATLASRCKTDAKVARWL